MNRIQAVSKEMLVVPAKPLKVKKAEALYDVPPVRMLIEGFIPRGMIVGLTSYPGTGKTWLAMEAARAVATGTPFLGKYPVKHARGRVLLVLGDASEADYGRQWRRLTKDDYFKQVIDSTPEAPETADVDVDEDGNAYPVFVHGDGARQIEVINPYDGIDYLAHSGFLFEEQKDVLALIATNKRAAAEREGEHLKEGGSPVDFNPTVTGYDLIVFDTLSALTRANQNDNSEMEVVFRNIRFIGEQTGAAILLLHHNAKPKEGSAGDDWRGAMAQIGALDCWFQLSGKVKTTARTLSPKKFRGITPEPIRFQLEVNDPGYARLYAETEDERQIRKKAEEDAARVKLQQAAGAVEQLKALGTFKRSQADAVLQKLIPGWASLKDRTLQRRTPEWLAEHGFVSEGDGAGRTYRFDGK